MGGGGKLEIEENYQPRCAACVDPLALLISSSGSVRLVSDRRTFFPSDRFDYRFD